MPAKTPTVAITGANGFVGSALVMHFASKGWHVRALVRNPEKYMTSRNVEYLSYDLRTSPDDKILKNVDFLVHAAYMQANNKNPDAYEVNIDAARQLLDICHRQNITKTLFMSTMSAHEEAESVYGKQKVAIEQLFNSSRDVVLRSGLIIGNGGIVKNMATFMRTKHAVPLIGGGKQPLQIIALDDLVSLIEKCLTGAKSGTYTVANPHVYTYKEFYEALAQRIRTKVFFIPVPFFLLLGILKLISSLHLPLAVSADNALGLKHLIAVDNRRDMEILGIKPVSLSEALAQINIT